MGSVDREKTLNFKILDIKVPRLDCVFISAPLVPDYQWEYRVEGILHKGNILRVLFGIRLISKETVNDQEPKVRITVEAIGTFKFDGDLPSANKVGDIPFFANLLALIYPFIREKISCCFTANSVQFYLPPINTFKLIKDNDENDTFKLTDEREEKLEED